MRTEPLAALALALVLATSGCYSTCDGSELFARAAEGELAAIHELGELGDPRVPSTHARVRAIREAFPVLAPFLEDEDPKVRLVATEALRRLAQRRPDIYRIHGGDLLDRPLTDADPEIRWRAAWALGRVEQTGPALRAAAADPDERVAERAVWALGRARDEEAVPALIESLGRGGRVAAQATRALRRVTGLRFDDPEEWQRWAREAPPPRRPPDSEPESESEPESDPDEP